MDDPSNPHRDEPCSSGIGIPLQSGTARRYPSQPVCHPPQARVSMFAAARVTAPQDRELTDVTPLGEENELYVTRDTQFLLDQRMVVRDGLPT